MRRAAIALVLIGLAATPARAHDFSPGVLSLVERAPGEYAYRFTPPVDDGVDLDVALRFPDGCDVRPTTVRCPAGLAGGVRFGRGLDRRTHVVVFHRPLDGPATEDVVAGTRPTWRPTAPRGLGAWVALGAEHVAVGLDHVAFVIGLLLVIGLAEPRGRLRRATLAITAFTVGHSLTLAAATLGGVGLPGPPVEACIALSVVLLAWEATHDRPTWTRRAPWVAALGFGLVHGLGFASVLAELGVPGGRRGPVLLAFNVGVELAQLAIVLAAAGIAWLLRDEGRRARVGRVAAHALGGVAVYWLIGRVLALGA